MQQDDKGPAGPASSQQLRACPVLKCQCCALSTQAPIAPRVPAVPTSGHPISSLHSKSHVWGSDPGASIPRGGEGGSLHPSRSTHHCFAAQRDVRNGSRSTSKWTSRVNTTALVSGGIPAPGTGRRRFPSPLPEAAGCPRAPGPWGSLSASPEVLGWDVPLHPGLVCTRASDHPAWWTPAPSLWKLLWDKTDTFRLSLNPGAEPVHSATGLWMDIPEG